MICVLSNNHLLLNSSQGTPCRLSSLKICLPSKVFFHQKWFSIKDCLLSKITLYYVCGKYFPYSYSANIFGEGCHKKFKLYIFNIRIRPFCYSCYTVFRSRCTLTSRTQDWWIMPRVQGWQSRPSLPQARVSHMQSWGMGISLLWLIQWCRILHRGTE